MGEAATLEGTIHSVVFQNAENGYTVLRLLTAEGDTVTVVGCIPAATPGEELSISGVWEEHPKHGEQFRAMETQRRLPETRAEILRFLSAGVCRGIGLVTARRIVERFGEETLEVLEYEPERLASVRGMTLGKAEAISAAFRETLGLRRLIEFLSQYQLPPVLAVRLRERFQDAALEKIQANPWLLSEDRFGVPFSLTDGIALEMGFPPDSPERVQAAVLFELNHNEGNGHVFLPRAKLCMATARLLACETELPERALDTLLERGDVVCQDIADEEACYLRRLWEDEGYACAKLNFLLSAAADQSQQAERTIREMEAAQGITYAPQQKEAVHLAAREGVVILTGGPGTGKTTTVRAIVALFQRMGLRIALSAPTGRAAQRLGEVTGLEAQTTHRLLGMSWDEAASRVSFAKAEQEPLSANAVIVDEMSMVDLSLFAALLRALRPGTRLVLVGDADQLPSVGSGNVFSDLIRSGRVRTVFLREVFRQAEQSAIIRNAHAVNLGQPPRLVNDQGDFFFLSRRDEQRAADTVVSLCASRLPENMGIPADEIQVLSPTRKGACGTVALNRALQAVLNPPKKGKLEILWGERLFRTGDRIMQTKNDYDVVWTKEDGTVGTGVFNGDVGRITEIDPSGQWLALDFDGRAAAYPLEMLNKIDLAYAMTVHKAQGSEYRCVILSAMPCAPGLMVRGVLYTALTRARELMVVVGDGTVLQAMAANNRQQRRYSGLRWRLSHGQTGQALG